MQITAKISIHALLAESDALAAADADSLCETLAALGGAQIKICGRDLIVADIKSIYNS